MLRRGLKTMNKLDKVKEKERLAKERAKQFAMLLVQGQANLFANLDVPLLLPEV